jgi:hypothetical protein
MNDGVQLEEGRRAHIVALTPNDVVRFHNLLKNLSDEDAEWSIAMKIIA